ncbi:hypothetical protein DB41_EB00010 [Neochlamydia sp. TUME1]|uniref:F-box-like domain-containing protein n=1 Tax=Neochlamydia sp. TUME1 TaxID=1478174 RepID=UPI00057F61A0|nr:F-box-like domain-containing protein [Neochlamydia sp. TUME1]KIC76876.1 hypothetical protein DB41_EB00010 [Neochlamydia sp. TUME1]
MLFFNFNPFNCIDLRSWRLITEAPPSIKTIPEELIVHIFSFLSPKELVNAQQVCKHWKKIGDEETLWKRHYQQHFKDEPLNISFSLKTPRSFRNSYLFYSLYESIDRKVKLEIASLRASPSYNPIFSERLLWMNQSQSFNH